MTTNTTVGQKNQSDVTSKYGYISGYKPKGITEQANRLRELFHGIGFVDEKIAEVELPKYAEGWFAIPKWEKVASTYNEAVKRVLAMIKKTRGENFYNFYHEYHEDQLGPDRLRQSVTTASVFQKLGDEQKDHDILVVPAQFGIRHRGRSVRRAREVFTSGEFGLGAFAIGIMILTHPERLQHYNDLGIDCAGDEYEPDDNPELPRSPSFGVSGNRAEFGTKDIDDVYNNYGSASGFFPQAPQVQ